MIIKPQDGAQTAFLASPADIVIYGGEAGGGKTAALVLEAMRGYDLPRFGGIIFRRDSPQLAGPGSLWDLMQQWYPALGARLTQDPYRAVFPSGAEVLLGHLAHEGDKYKHQGKGYGLVAFDELPHFSESQFWYLWSRARSMSGVKPYARATLNPDPDTWVKRMILWYLDDEGRYVRPERSGQIRYFYRIENELVWSSDPEDLKARHPEMVDGDGVQFEPTSFSFILARLIDNPILTSKDPGYIAKLMAMPKVERERLLGQGRGGDWKIRPAAGLYYQRGFFQMIERAPITARKRVRGWDFAASMPTPQNPDPDWTRGVKMSLDLHGRYVIEDVASLRGGPAANAALRKSVAAQDGPMTIQAIWQDPGQAGKDQVATIKSELAGFVVRSMVARENKIAYAGPLSTQAENGNVYMVRAPWNDAFLAEMEGFPGGPHDDIPDAAARAFIELATPGAEIWRKALENR